jgi:histidinol-phosphate/aromatic aminotransferase/cobyric acid decarboxylase-like protein
MNPDAVARLLSTGSDDGADAVRVPHGSSDDPQVLDFSANTNPRYPDGLAGAYSSALQPARSYPADDYSEYRIAAGEYVGCEPQWVVPTPGGLAAMRLAIGVTVRPDESVVVPTPSFGEYDREVRLQGGEPVHVAHDAVLDTDPVDHAMVIVCNPNNPTGEAYDADALRSYAVRCREADTVLMIDEAFLGFTAEPSLAGTAGVVAVRSLTKLFGLPGLRMGFAVATGDRHDRLAAARRTWNLSVPAMAVGEFCMGRSAFVERTHERVSGERDRLGERLSTRFDVWPSDAPFLLLDAGSSEAADRAIDDARGHDVVIRDARTFRGLDSHVRVAVRLPDENDRLLAALGV